MLNGKLTSSGEARDGAAKAIDRRIEPINLDCWKNFQPQRNDRDLEE